MISQAYAGERGTAIASRPSENNFFAVDDAYRIAIQNLAKYKDSRIFKNTGPENGAVVLGNIFKTATNYVNIFAGNFKGDISDNDYYLYCLKSFLNRNLPLTIVFARDPNPDSKALALLKQYSSNKISLRKISPETTLNKNHHFTIGDSRMFRIETSENPYEAFCSFNDIDTCQTLEKEFTSLINVSEKYLGY